MRPRLREDAPGAATHAANGPLRQRSYHSARPLLISGVRWHTAPHLLGCCGFRARIAFFQAGRRRSFARQGLSDEASRSLVLVGVCGDDSALWGYGRKPPLTHILPHYHVTWRTPAAPPLGDAFDLAHPPLPVLRTGAARRLLKALCTFWEGCCCCRLRATGNAITPSPRDGGSYRVALQQYKSFWQDSTLAPVA